MGINYRDNPARGTAPAFLRANKVTYPSLADDGGRTILGAAGQGGQHPDDAGPRHQQGRIAARVAGQVSRATLDGLVDDVLGRRRVTA